MDYPAAEFVRARYARNVYLAMTGYRKTTDLVAWCDANPDAWELVSYIFKLREESGQWPTALNTT